jgi:uncharacterized protein (TIGR03435 family)
MPPSFPLNIDDTPIPPGGSFRADFPLRVYIEFAYKLQLSREQREAMLSHLPQWVGTQAFVIEAKADGNPTKDQIRLVMQTLLADRFKLTVHFETREMSVLALELVKPGVTGRHLRPHAQGLACDGKWIAPPDRGSPDVEPGAFVPDCGDVSVIDGPKHTLLLGARNIPMEHIADYLPLVYDVGRPVIDETGLTGTFDFSLNWAPDRNDPASILPSDSPDSEGSSFLEALKEQLGLTLKPKTAPIRTLIIDHIEPPSPN